MWSLPACSPRRGILVAVAILAITPSALARQTDNWTGTSTNTPNNSWTDITNWSPGTAVPGSGNTDVAQFPVISNSNTSISLNGTALTPGAIQFGTSGSGITGSNGTNASAYTIGSSTSDGSFTFSGVGTVNAAGGGLIDIGPAVNAAQVINSPITFTGASPSIIVNEGQTGASLTINGPVALGSGSNNLSVSSPSGGQTNGSPVTIINGLISGAGLLLINGGASNTGSGVGASDTLTAGSYEPTAQNTYSGGTSFAAQNPIILVAANSMGAPGAVTSGPFGTGTINLSVNNARFRPVGGGNYLIYNAITQTGLISFDMESNQPNDPGSITFAGPITSPSGGTYNTNGFINSEGFSTPLYGATMILGLASNPSTFTVATSGNTRFNALTGPIVINDKIIGSPTGSNIVVFNSQNVISTTNGADMYSVQINNPNSTYTGNTLFGNATNSTTPMGAILIGASTIGSPGSITSGPFGLTTLIPANSNTSTGLEQPPDFVPVGADQTLANNLTIGSTSPGNGSGFMVSNSWTNTINIRGTITSFPMTDPTGNHNLFLTGTITVATGKVIDNNMASEVALYFGGMTTAASPSTFSLGASTNTLKIQTNMSGVGGVTIINDVVSGSGNLTVLGGAVVQLNNVNTYTGNTLVIGAGGPSNTGGSAAVGTGGTLGGTGTIVSSITISSTTPANQGGIIYPGPGGANAGTLTVGTMQWNPYGRYVFVYNPSNTTTGGGVNSLISGSGGATLDLSNLGSTTPFDLNLLPLSMYGTGAQQTYVIADFTGGITGTVMGTPTQPIPNGTDISSLFTLSGTYTSAPAMFATVVAGPGGGTDQAIDLTITTPAPQSSFTWTGSVSGSWMNASNWSPAVTPPSNLNTQLTFGATANAAMTNDIAGTFTLNSMTFNAGSPVYTLSGNGLNFVTNGNGTNPAIVSNSSNSVTLSVTLTLTNNLTVSGSGNVTLGGVIGGAGALTMSGTGTLSLTNSGNNFSGGVNVLSGTVQVADDADLGTGNVTGATLGTLSFTGSTATTKSFAMNGGTITVASGQTVTFNGSQLTSVTLDGTGTFATNGAIISNGNSTASVAISSNSASDRFVHFTNNAALTFAGGLNPSLSTAVANLNGFINQGSGSVTIGAGSAINAANFQSYGTLSLTPNTTSAPTVFTNTGSATLGFDGGSRTFIGTPGTADPTGQNIVDYVDLHGHNAVVTDALFVNNGGIYDTVGAGSSTVIADYGSLVKGAGFYQNTVKTQNGGKFQTGNSPGSATFGNFVFGPGGVSNYIFAIDDATGTAGPSPGSSGLVSGWGLIKAVQVSLGAGTTSGNFTWTATPSNPLTVAINTLVNPTMVGTDVAGPMADFDPTQAYSWTAAHWTGTYAGPTDAAMLDADTSFNTTGFANPIAGTFAWSLDPAGQTLSLVYTPSSVPEPGSLTLIGLAAAAGWWRRRTARSA